jgi:hypothetical protein
MPFTIQSSNQSQDMLMSHHRLSRQMLKPVGEWQKGTEQQDWAWSCGQFHRFLEPGFA